MVNKKCFTQTNVRKKSFLCLILEESSIADLGCGEARIAKTIPSRKIYSFDLVSLDANLVISADIAHLPLPDASVDVCIFCLSLMGTNWPEYLVEGTRILRKK